MNLTIFAVGAKNNTRFELKRDLEISQYDSTQAKSVNPGYISRNIYLTFIKIKTPEFAGT